MRMAARTPLPRPAAAPRVLVVDDHAEIRDALSAYLRRQGMEVVTAANAAGMHLQLVQHSVDLIVLDIMLPDQDGLSLCQQLSGSLGTPVILLTARAGLQDRIAGLQHGADDYVVKPFEPSELVARIHAVLRRQARPAPAASSGALLGFDGWVFDAARRTLTDPHGQPVAMSEAEFQLLSVFMGHANEVLSRDRLLDLTQRRDQRVFDRSIDTQVSRLRRKLEADPRHPKMLKTAWGNGYIFVADVRAVPA
jgi:two-component system OmpR family response regulator